MSEVLANDFTEIPTVLSQNEALRNAVVALVATDAMAGKVTEGGDRLERFRAILTDLVNGQIGLGEAIRRTQAELPRQTSPYSGNNRVFASNWEERLVRTQLSRFYNQGVMEQLLAEGETQCFVPHSPAEDPDSNCSRQLAGQNHDVKALYERLVTSYRDGVWSQSVKIPDHPHCTHVVTRAKSASI
jgi:hypothetical protein